MDRFDQQQQQQQSQSFTESKSQVETQQTMSYNSPIISLSSEIREKISQLQEDEIRLINSFVEDQQRLLNTMIDSFQQRLQERRKTVDSIVEELDELNSANYQLQQGVESIEFQIKSLHQNILTRK